MIWDRESRPDKGGFLTALPILIIQDGTTGGVFVMVKKHDVTGQRFGKLTAIHYCHSNKQGRAVWLCKCDCGKETKVVVSKLLNGHTQSCGCYHRERAALLHTTHNMRHSKIYTIWAHMIQRCKNPKENAYNSYGGRGITVCDKWQTFDGFYGDMGFAYQDGYSIERIDVNGNYEPKNCTWIPLKEQSWNRRNSQIYEVDGIKGSLPFLCNHFGAKYVNVDARIRRGWPVEKALKAP
jgi:hypothetical protein